MKPAQRIKVKSLQKQDTAAHHYHSLKKNFKEKAAISDSRRRGILKNQTQQKGSSKNVNTSEMSRVSKKRKRCYTGLSRGSNKRGRSRNKMKFALDDSLDHGDDGTEIGSLEHEEDDIVILGEMYNDTFRFANSYDSEDDDIVFLGETDPNAVKSASSQDSEDEDIVFLRETDLNTVNSASSHDSEEDDIVILGETNPNTVNSADAFEGKEIETEESSGQGKDAEDSSEQNLEENDKFESIQSEFATTSEQEDESEENGNDNVSTNGSKLKSSTSRRQGKELLELHVETSFDCSNEALPSAAAENEESDVSNECLSSSDTEPDDSDDKDFDIENPDSPVSEESFSSFEDEADAEEMRTEAEEQSVEQGTSHVHGPRSKYSRGEKKISVPIFQEPGRRGTAIQMPEICEETKGQKENLYCDGVEEEEFLRCSVVKGESSGKKSRIGASNLQESSGRESSNTKHKEAEGLKEHLGHNTVQEAERSRNKPNKKAQDLPKSTKSKPVQIQEDCPCKRINEPLRRKQSCSGMKNRRKENKDECDEISKKDHGPDYESCGSADKMFSAGKSATVSNEAREYNTTKEANRNEDSNMKIMVEDPGKENSNHHNSKILGTSPYSAGTSEKNEIGFSKKTNQNQKKSHLSKALIDSMLRRFEVLEEKSCEPEVKESCEPEAAKQPSSTERTLPLKFRFEGKESKPVQKSEHEIMVEGLFSEMDTCMVSDMSNDSPEDANEKPEVCSVNENRIHPCREGKHDLVILEHIGEVCRRCNHVEREMKHILPSFGKMQGSGDRKYVDKGQFSGAVDFASSVDNFGKSFIGSDGTVWDMIPGVKETMYQHQQDGFEFLWKNLEGTVDLAELRTPNSRDVGGCIISHAPGTGKTRLTIVFIETYLKIFPDARPVIIAPASMLLTWEEEFRKWKVECPFHNLSDLELSGKEHKNLLGNISVGKSRDKFIRLVKMYSWNQEKSILGMSYQLFEKLVGERHRRRRGSKNGQIKVVDQESENVRKILLEQPRLVVLDEGHTPRSQRSCIWNTLLKLQTERRIILSGTPFQNNFGELFNTLHLVRPTIASALAKEKAFAEMIPSRGRKQRTSKYTEGETSLTGSSAEEAKLIEMLKERMAPFVHIHKGSILQKSLPGLRDCVILLNPPAQQKCLIEKIEPSQGTFQYEHKVALLSVHPSLLQNCLLSDQENSNADLEMLTRLRRDPNAGVKTRFIMELVRLSNDLNERVLIFSQFIQPLKLIKDQLIDHFTWEEGKQIFVMQGRLDQKQRQCCIEIFNDPKSKAQVLLASTKCCSEGINLVGASRIVLLDVVWNPSVERQAISRAYRLGQKKVVFTYHLMTSGTTEGDKYCRQAEKDRFSELVFSSTTKEDDKQKKPSPVFNDGILKEMIDNANLMGMFEKIIYQPKEVNLVETFGSASAL